MALDVEKLLSVKIYPKKKDILVPQLKPFFGEDEPIITVRGLNAEEICYCNQAAKGYSQMEHIIKGMLGDNAENKVQSIMASLGLHKEIPEDYAKRIEHFILGVLSPEGINREMVIVISNIAPIEFLYITNEILRLSGEGADILGE